MNRLPIVLLVTACGGSPKQPLPPERDDAPEGKGSAVSVTAGAPVAKPLPAPPAGFAAADLVTMRGGELATWSTADSKLTKLGSVILADVPEGDLVETMAVSGIGKGDWADRDHLFVSLGERSVVMITATAITRVTIPDAATFETPKPPDPDGDITKANNVGLESEGLQINDKGEVYWSQCGWGRGYDGYICDAWVHVQVWPNAKRLEGPTQGPIAPRRWAWAKQPDGFKAAIKGQTLSCNGPAGRSTLTARRSDGEELDGVHWVSATPPRMLVIYGHAGLADIVPDRWTVHDGCKGTPLAEGSTVEPGPDGLWIGTVRSEEDEGASTLYRGARPLGELPAHARVLMRPR